MEIMNAEEIPSLLRDHLQDLEIHVTFVQWESDDPEEDESITEFDGVLVKTSVSENKFQGFDGLFHFQLNHSDDISEILMDFPSGSEDVVATLEDSVIRIFGDESMLTLLKLRES
ncbi:hypothetical protein [Ammoniphilus resinae]|uniref:Uncharacterized protein n=1 Tax=Ammoniphilus resinae TaxID=861532 RepID=A0ABS4GX38_9BACL|nr:hypothetical protein [Ammoniphilus resinae]MBP1934597.1 hypothetical protein [Ammoniphilus resinae]